ncbi:hypothetical protein H2198_005865 [Neophaeococcomyces mojaviensis]|uniref:Uncharacterized protein n=1 Tax=Neophaeococcomyces mojaviensis TaxID=3383035 RepID=A0ACC3A4J7_9EURO|nr:hypothetical protein H2198_005865 [Knufia sp. JES_112]
MNNHDGLRQVRTAGRSNTIWRKLPEDAFRGHLIALERLTNAVPIDTQVFELEQDATDDADTYRILSLRTEQQVADDFAFLAAVQEGAQSVAAVCLEQHLSNKSSLKARLAAIDTLDEKVKSTLNNICGILMRISTHNDASEHDCIEELFQLIIVQHHSRLLARLRSRKWLKPRYLAASHKKPLWQDLANVVHRVQHAYPRRKEQEARRQVEQDFIHLASVYEDFESCEDDEQERVITNLVQLTYELCRRPYIRDFASKLESLRPTAQIAAAIKSLHQLEKIGAYYRIAKTLISTAIRYRGLFGDISLEYLTPYASTPTSIAYESWAKTCHVHAEIQLVVDYDLCGQKAEDSAGNAIVVWPRVIGTSKYLCYLCYRFITHHGRFFVTNTHGRLYDQWTVPDLEAYEETLRARYAAVLEKIDDEVRTMSDEVGGNGLWRAEPMTSRQNLLLHDAGPSM